MQNISTISQRLHLKNWGTISQRLHLQIISTISQRLHLRNRCTISHYTSPEIVLEKLRYHLQEITLAKYKYNLPEIALEKLRYDRHGDCPPLLNHLQRDGTSILQVQSPWRSSIIKYMTISIRDCTLKNRDDLWEIVPEFLKYHLWEIVPSKMVTISGDRFGRSSPFFGSFF